MLGGYSEEAIIITSRDACIVTHCETLCGRDAVALWSRRGRPLALRSRRGRLLFGHANRSLVLLLQLALAAAAAATVTAQAHAYIVRAEVPPGSVCNDTAAYRCFVQLFTLKEEACVESMPRLRCHDYKFLDDCFRKHAGQCTSAVVGNAIEEANRHVNDECARRSANKANREVFKVAPSRYQADKAHKMVAMLGHLQTSCAIASHENCSSPHFEHWLEACDRTLRARKSSGQLLLTAQKAAAAAGVPPPITSDFDRHKLLLIKLDTSKRLLEYPDTNKERECWVIRSTLTDLYRLQHRNCFHSVVTRCMCERSLLEQACGIRCAGIEASGPDDEDLGWNEFKVSLLKGSRNGASSTTLAHTCLILLFIMSLLHRI